MNASEEEWGEDRMMNTVESCNGLPARELLHHVFTAADAFVAGAKQHDDMTLVVLRAVRRD
jgi:sigma-B regulation protein RsbU (phosphoserine phosphatase)